MTSGADPASAAAFLIAGAGGMLGTALQQVIPAHGARFSAPLRADFDIADPVAVRHRVAEFVETLLPGQPGVLVNAAAYTNVERAEDEPERAYLVNEHGAALLAREALACGLFFVHVSTDFVFDGLKGAAYTEVDEPCPLSVYGRTKLAGEVAVIAENPEALVVRTAWTFGLGGDNFPEKILSAALAGRPLRVVTDQIGSPTYARDLAGGIVGLVDAGAHGLFHLAGSGACSRYEFAVETLRLAGVKTGVEPVTSDEFPVKAARPGNSVLDCTKAAGFGIEMAEWHDAIARFVRELQPRR